MKKSNVPQRYAEKPFLQTIAKKICIPLTSFNHKGTISKRNLVDSQNYINFAT